MAGNITPIDNGTNIGEWIAAKLFGRSLLARPDGTIIDPPTRGGIASVGTRRYGAPLARVPFAAQDAASEAMPADTAEVLLHASARCFVRVGAASSNNAIPLEAGEKFHLRAITGETIHVVQDSATGFLNVIPVLPE